jgi:hypothetical protein
MYRTHSRESQIVPVRMRSNPPRATRATQSPHRATQSPHRATLATRATSQPSRKSPLSITKMFSNPDVKSEVLYRYVKNDYTILNKNTLAEVRKKLDNIQAVFGKTSYTPELLNGSTGNIKHIILVKVKLDYVDVVILKHTIQDTRDTKVSKDTQVKSILLSDITFATEEARNLFSTIFQNVSASVENLLLKNIDIRGYFNAFISSIANIKNLRLLEVSHFNIVDLLTSVSIYNDGFDYLFMKVIVKLPLLEELIFVGNNINDAHYKYLFNDYYKFNHGYIIHDDNAADMDGMYLKYNMTEIGELSKYTMNIVAINNRGKWGANSKCTSERTIFYFTKNNYYLKGKGMLRPLPDYENDNFIVGKKNKMVLLCNELRKCNPEDMKEFILPCPTGHMSCHT